MVFEVHAVASFLRLNVTVSGMCLGGNSLSAVDPVFLNEDFL
jgi:hypothetical protein